RGPRRVRRAAAGLSFRGAARRVPGFRWLRVRLGRRAGLRRGDGHREAPGHRRHPDSRRRGARVRRAEESTALFRRRYRRETRGGEGAVILRRTLADREDVLGVAMLTPPLISVTLRVAVPC